MQALGLAAERQRVKINAAYLLEQEKLAELQRAKQVGASTTTSSSSTSTSTSATSTSSASGSSSSGAGAGAGAGGDRLLLNRLDVFEAGPVGHHYSLTEFPPSLVAVAPKPALFDLAVNGYVYCLLRRSLIPIISVSLAQTCCVCVSRLSAFPLILLFSPSISPSPSPHSPAALPTQTFRAE